MKEKTKTRYAVIGIYNDDDNFCPLVIFCRVVGTLAEAKRIARQTAENERVADGRDIPFDEAWESVSDPYNEDWGFDPIDNKVASLRIRVVRIENAKELA